SSCPFRALSARDALGPPSGSGRIKHHRPLLGLATRRGVGCRLLAQLLERQIATCRNVNSDTQSRSCLAGARNRLCRNALIHQNPCLAILQAIVELLRLAAPVDGRNDDACKLAGPVQGCRLTAVLEQRDEAVARPESQAIEARDHA